MTMSEKGKIKFVIVSPRQRNSGGAVVLHKLCKMLSEDGYDAKIYYTEAFNYSENKFRVWIKFVIKTILFLIRDTILVCCVKIIGKKRLQKYNLFNGYAYYQIRGCQRKVIPRVDDNTIVVYPEVVRGNFLHARKVIRWFLYYNKYLLSSDNYDENDLFICYREIFNDWNLNPNGNKVCISSYDLETYKQTNFGERKGNCYIIRKGCNRKDLPQKFDGIIIDKLSEIKKVEILNKCKYCYIYDTQTAYAKIAALCGCIPIVIPEEGKNRYDYLKKDDDKGFGVAYGTSESEIKFALETRQELVNWFKQKEKLNEENLELFIKFCREHYIDECSFNVK